jgi:hypothetical protein
MAWGENNEKESLYLNRYRTADGKTVHRLSAE